MFATVFSSHLSAHFVGRQNAPLLLGFSGPKTRLECKFAPKNVLPFAHAEAINQGGGGGSCALASVCSGQLVGSREPPINGCSPIQREPFFFAAAAPSRNLLCPIATALARPTGELVGPLVVAPLAWPKRRRRRNNKRTALLVQEFVSLVYIRRFGSPAGSFCSRKQLGSPQQPLSQSAEEARLRPVVVVVNGFLYLGADNSNSNCR